jgi:hypothetical protein
MYAKITEELLSELTGNYTDVSSIKKENCTELAFYLFRETAILVILVSSILKSIDDDNKALPRNQAICAGLLVRIMKFMGAVLSLMIDRVRDHGEVIMATNRCIIESSINLKFFCDKASEQDFDLFVKSGLGPDKELFDNIQENISNRGHELPIETRMLRSINNLFKISGVSDLTELDNIPRWKNYKTILRELDLESAYAALQRIPSHLVHGTWPDLAMHHLEAIEGGFEPNLDSITPDPRLLCPINNIVLLSVKSYIEKYFSDVDGIALIIDKADDLIKRNDAVDRFHESSLSAQ